MTPARGDLPRRSARDITDPERIHCRSLKSQRSAVIHPTPCDAPPIDIAQDIHHAIDHDPIAVETSLII